MSKPPTTSIDFILTKHGQTRMGQRNFSRSDLSLIATYGTEVNALETVLKKKDVEREISQIQIRIDALQRRTVKRCGTKARGDELSVAEEISQLRKQITNFERLQNCKIVANGKWLITCCRGSKSDLKRISRILN